MVESACIPHARLEGAIMETIAITDFPGIRIGQVEDREGATGATVIICEAGMAAGIDVRGGGPASRDTRILDPLAAAERIHAVLLAGGSAFGLDAAAGVQRYLEERGIGLPVGDAVVPLVCQSDIFDLMIGSSSARPDAHMGYDACVAAERGNYRDGNYGVGCGASIGKIAGPEYSMKSGIGSYAVKLGELMVGAIVAVNAIGDVYDAKTGQPLAAVLNESRDGFRSTCDIMYAAYEAKAGEDSAGAASMPTNTTIGAVITNAALSKAQLCKLAGMAHDGYARAIRPVHTSMDGDSIYGLSVGDVKADLDVVGTLAADVMAQAIANAVLSAEPAYGLLSARSI